MMEKGREKAANATKAENAIVAKKGSSRGAADRYISICELIVFYPIKNTGIA